MTVHLIWKHVPHHYIDDSRECVGVVTTGWEDADAVVDALNEADDKRNGSFMTRRNYWKTEIKVLDLWSLCRTLNV